MKLLLFINCFNERLRASYKVDQKFKREIDMKLDETKRQKIIHPIPPLYDKDSKILILGSFPSVKSREEAFFYGHKQNRFWKLLAGILSEDKPETVEDKKEFLHRNHIAVWDVIHSCDIIGSSDSSIRNVVPNDLSEILEGADIRQIYCNGAKSYEYYRKYQEKETGRKAKKLPSTSPANAAFSIEKLTNEWKVICEPLQVAPAGIGEVLLKWYDYNARILPWRSEPTPYHVWISEIMLQQTRVEAVKKYYERWMEELPDIKALAEVSDEKLMKLWEGLGYYNRARNLKAAATQIMQDFGGKLPADYEALLSLKGIGEYTAGAISSIAFGIPKPAVDGNALRIFSRILAEDGEITKASVKKRITQEVCRVLPKGRSGDFNQALMDLGSAICIPNGEPFCEECPWESVCQAHKYGRETEFPVKAKKKKRKIEKKAVFLIELSDKIILHKRLETGLLGGLWEFPNRDMDNDGKISGKKLSELIEKWGITDYVIEPLGEGKHIFSHVEWQMRGYRLHVQSLSKKLLKQEEWVLVSKEDLEEKYAMPSAFECYKLR